MHVDIHAFKKHMALLKIANDVLFKLFQKKNSQFLAPLSMIWKEHIIFKVPSIDDCGIFSAF